MSVDFAVAQLDGKRTAVEGSAAAKDRAGEDARWTREVGIVEHGHNGRPALRGTLAGNYVDVDESDVAELEASLSATPPLSRQC